ncbi:hypothetical protein T08_9600 [Trichinella sp. T8]|nr:hypothetical protein T08_9600 [Trichinella sp. T8]
MTKIKQQNDLDDNQFFQTNYSKVNLNKGQVFG